MSECLTWKTKPTGASCRSLSLVHLELAMSLSNHPQQHGVSWALFPSKSSSVLSGAWQSLLSTQICTCDYTPNQMSLGLKDGIEGLGWSSRGVERWRGDGDGLADVHTNLSCKLCIWVVRERKWWVAHAEWFRICVKPVGLGRAFVQRNASHVCIEIPCQQ